MSFLIGTLSFVMVAISLFMILLVLIQRGRGGGLAGAFGGMGGQSAFGTRAGDMFTRITIVLAVVWVLLAGGLGMLMRRDAEASKKGETSVFDPGKDSDKKDDADNKAEDSLKSGDATDTGTDVKSKTENVVPPVLKIPAETDAAKSEDQKKDAETPDVEKTDESEVEKAAPVDKADEPAQAEPAKEVSAEPATPGIEDPAAAPNP